MFSKELNYRERQKVFLNNNEIPGLQSVDFTYATNGEVLRYLGMAKCNTIPTSPYVGTASISSLLISDDMFLPFTGTSGFNGYIFKDLKDIDNSENIHFTSGFLSSYTQSCTIGTVPSIDVGINILGDIGQLKYLLNRGGRGAISRYTNDDNELTRALITANLNVIKNNFSDQTLQIAYPGSIEINIDDLYMNHIVSYGVSINIDRNPIYVVGEAFPSSVVINTPINVSCNIQVDITDYQLKNLRNYPWNKTVESLEIKLNNLETNNNIYTYSFGDMELRETQYRAGIADNAVVNLVFQGYLK